MGIAFAAEVVVISLSPKAHSPTLQFLRCALIKAAEGDFLQTSWIYFYCTIFHKQSEFSCLNEAKGV